MKELVSLLILFCLISFATALSCTGAIEHGSEIDIVRGTYNSGTADDLKVIDGVGLSVHEVVGSPALEIYFNITDSNMTTGIIWNFTTVVWHNSPPGHEIDIQILENGNGWEHLIHVPTNNGFVLYKNNTIGTAGYINDEGTIQLRLVHLDSGNINSEMIMDYGALAETCILVQETQTLNIINGYLDTSMFDVAITIALLFFIGLCFYIGATAKNINVKILGYFFTGAFIIILLAILLALSTTQGTVVLNATNSTTVGETITTVYEYEVYTMYDAMADFINLIFEVFTILIFPLIAGLVLLFAFMVIRIMGKTHEGRNMKDNLWG